MTRPTPPQREAIPLIRSGANTLVVSPTGSGKTEAAILPILDQMIREDARSFRGVALLYVTPLRALNRDLLDRVTKWCRALDIRLAVRHGDTGLGERRAQTLVPPHVLITTPETLQVLLVARRFKEHLRALRWVVVDEIHELATDKRGTQLAVALERLRDITESDFQRIGLSATVGDPEKIGSFLVGAGRKCEIAKTPVAKLFKFEVVYPQAGPQDEAEAVRLSTHPEAAARIRTILRLLNEGPLLIFTNTRTEAEILGSRLRQWSPRIAIAVHHGSLSRTSRERAEEELKSGRLKGVVCTSSLELGIDVGLLNLVIQYNSPRQVVRLIQRAGRSGHTLERTSRCVVICQDADDALEAAVLGRRASAELLEAPEVHTKCSDVLVQQLAGILIERGSCELPSVLSTLRRSFPYQGLSNEELEAAVNYMATMKPKLATVRGNEITRPYDRRYLFSYYFDNLSMIPEQRQYPVVTEDKETVGLLDEDFVAEHGEIGKKFILRGSVWRINQVFNSKVYVDKDEDPLGAIPSWAGEEIPVPLEVAREVGEIRRKAAEAAKEGALQRLCDEMSKKYPMAVEDLERSLSSVALQIAKGFPVPSDAVITIEQWGSITVVVTHRGLRVNRTLGRVLADRCSTKLGKPVSVNQDAYRIYLDSKELTAPIVDEALHDLANADLNAIIKTACEDTGLFRRRFVHVARKMGILSRDAELTSAIVRRLVDTLKGSPPYQEAWRTFLQEDLDAKGTSAMLHEVSIGAITVVALGRLKEPTPIAIIGLEEMTRKGEVMDPAKMKRLLVESARTRVLNGRLTMVCLKCKDFVEERYIVDMKFPIVCPSCGGSEVAVSTAEKSALMDLMRRAKAGRRLAPALKRRLTELTTSAYLNSKYGEAAAKGQLFNIPLKRLAPLLSRSQGTEDELLLQLLEEERRSYLKRFIRR